MWAASPSSASPEVPGSAAASSGAARRLRRELEAIWRCPNAQVTVRPSESSLLEWHFALHSLPEDTPYGGGCYHGRLLFPPQYPNSPPTVVMVTPSGRLETGCRLCLSMTDFHPESWNPAWSVDTMLIGLVSFFLSDSESGYGSVVASDASRRQLAEASWATNAKDSEFVRLFPEFLQPTQTCSLSEADGSLPDCFEDEAAAMEEGRSTPAECWICRDTGSHEPLIHPCACRGSMSGVHQSCVEEWMRHQRRAGGVTGRPRCGVCRQAYLGYEERPGLGGFACYYAQDFSSQLTRSAMLVSMLMGFQDCTVGNAAALPMLARIAFMFAFCLMIMHRFGVLAASLPMHRPPPRDPRMRRLYTNDPHSLARNSAEALTTTCVLGVWYARDELPLMAFLPFAILGVGLVLKLCSSHSSISCLRQLLRSLYELAVAVPRASLRGGSRLMQQPWQVLSFLHPLEPWPHMLAACAVCGLALLCSSNVPVVLLLGAHSALLLAGVVERAMATQLHWRRKQCWLYVMQLAFLSTYVANALCSFPQGFGQPESTCAVVLIVSSLWFGCVCTMAMSVNWVTCVRHYRAWQRQHGQFTLAAPHGGAMEAV
eukprot:TRINITY_DN102243_c0_g1_i1.p1 TRINITY_DN102243_c0_g1~~TRINITY_DN102243_c0_g1_i1.p1  ORF type:complete len:599 (-),score=61.22 TRINITY_DN102243_c0_g1_i1:143-1939(-)